MGKIKISKENLIELLERSDDGICTHFRLHTFPDEMILEGEPIEDDVQD